MGTWSIITPSGIEPASIDENGNATFHKNTGNTEVHYTVKYVGEDGIVCTSDVIQKGNPCSYNYSKNKKRIPSNGGLYVFGTLSNIQGQTITVKVTEGSSYIDGTLSINSSNQVVGTVKNNDSQTTRTIRYELNTSDGNVCYSETAIQEEGCNCRSFIITELPVGKDGGTYTFATYTADPCITEVTATEDSSWITSIGVNASDKSITGTVLSNPGIYNRTATISVNGNAGNIQCPLTFQLTQSGTGCECDAFWIRSELPSPWDWDDDKTEKYVSIDYKICVSEISVSPTEHFNARRISTAMRIVFSPRGKNTTDEPFEDTLVVSYKVEGKEEKCFIEIPLRQEMNGCGCDEKTVNLSWNWNESDTKTVTVSVEECVEGLSYNQVDDYIITNDGNILSINPDGENKGTQNRDGIIIVQYSTGSKPCSKHINVTQGIRNCGCGDFVYTENSTKAYGNAQGRVLLGTLSNIKEGCLDGISVSGGSQTIKLVDGTTTYEDDFTNIEIDSRTNEVYGSFDYNPFMGDNVHEDYRGCGRILRYDVLMNDIKCGDTHTITQQGWRGTDNGIDRFINPQTGENVENKYPILMCSNSGEINGDTVVCENGAYWNGIKVGNDFNLYFKSGYDTPYPEDPGDYWLHVYGTTDGGYCQIGYLNMVTEKDNDTNKTRKAVFWLSSDPTPGESGRQEPVNILEECGTIRPDHGGEECALKWRYEVWQAKAGCKWCRNEEKLDYYEVPITGKCDCKYDEKSCGSYQELIIYEYKDESYNTHYLLSIYDGGFKILTINDNKAMRLTNGVDDDCYYDVKLEKDDDGNIIGIANLDYNFTCPGELDSIECVINTQDTEGKLQILQVIIIGEQYSLIAEFEKDSPIKLPIKMYKP